MNKTNVQQNTRESFYKVQNNKKPAGVKYLVLNCKNFRIACSSIFEIWDLIKQLDDEKKPQKGKQ